MSQVKILIVEDEMIIASDISLRLSELGYDIAETFDEVDLAIDFLANEKVDLVLLDISLDGEKTGIDLARIINKRFKLPFIFLTSNTDKHIFEEAKKVNPSAYLLKPFNHRQVSASIDMALYNFYGDKSKEETHKTSANKQEILQHPNSLFLRKGHHYEKVKFDDILWLEAESNYTYIHTISGKFTYSTVLKKFESKLPTDRFLRVHRSYIVNMNNVSGFEGNMLLINGKQIPVNKSSRDDVFRRFEIV